MDTFQDLVSMRLAFEDEAKAPSLTEFKRFSELPQELRLMIWRFTVPVSRLVKDRFCIQPYIPRPCPQNSIPYASMPGSFRACFESKEEITKYLARAEYGGVRGQARDKLPIYSAPSVPFNPDKDIISYESLFTISTGYLEIIAFLRGQGALPLGLPDWRTVRFRNYQPWIIKPWTVKRVQIGPRPLLLTLYNHRLYEKVNFATWDRVFIGFVFQDLDEFIVQDFDCKLTEKHSFYSSEGQKAWKKQILLMLQVETTHDEYSVMRAGPRFKIPKIIIRKGAKVEGVCQNCRELSKGRQMMKMRKKRMARENTMLKQCMQEQSLGGTNGTPFEEW